MSAQNSAGIQTLLDAEREAQKIVQQARTYRTQRVKDARTEATKQIALYKTQKEQEFQTFQSQHSGNNALAEAAAEKQVAGQLESIKEAGRKGEEKVVEGLIKGATEVKPEPHRNLRKAGVAA
ncbi:vacuolar ATPase [Peziza echinospora]|nr:vacuolar ATPase [Peziza echinospora]